MKRICLALPTHRECGVAITALVQEANYALAQFEVAVDVLIADTSTGTALASNMQAAQACDAHTHPRLRIFHFDRDKQDALLRQLLRETGLTDPGRALDLLLPDQVSYGAAMNRLFIFAELLGCASLHRRDSDSLYQNYNAQVIYPIAQELRYLGRSAQSIKVNSAALSTPPNCCPVYMVGGSYIGEPSVDVARMFDIDADAAYQIVGLFAPSHLPQLEKTAWVDSTYLKTGLQAFTADETKLGYGHSYLVDTCNLCFAEIQRLLPVPTACNTIGVDYFLINMLDALKYPVLHHNRHIQNFYTPERRTPAGFIDYQFRMVKYYLYMSYLHSLLACLRTDAVPTDITQLPVARLIELIQEPAPQLRIENFGKLEILYESYVRLGTEYAEFAELLKNETPQLVDECANDINDFGWLSRQWQPLMAQAASTTSFQCQQSSAAA